jgi:oligopeptide transport system permease protein
MLKFLGNRLISMIITLWLIITLTFVLMNSVPGGPFSREKNLPEPIKKALEAKYNLNQPLWRQYTDYLVGIAKLDLGPSFQKIGVKVNTMIKTGFPISAKLGVLSVLLVLALGVPLGIISALKASKWQDNLVMFFATLGITIPGFVIATLYIYIFAGKLNWVPSFGLASWKSYIGPVLALSGFSLAFVSRLTRSSMLEVLQQDYIRTARAKGLSQFKVIYKHALRNAIIPVVTYIGPLLAGIITGSFVVERIFAIPGMGKYFVESVTNRDYTVIMGITVFDAALLVGMVLIVDIVYGLIDPRIKLGK